MSDHPLAKPLRLTHRSGMSRRLAPLTRQFREMQSDDITLARDRFRLSARLRRRGLQRVWARNRAVFLGIVAVSVGTLAGSSWVFARVLGSGVIAKTWGPGLALGGLLLLARATGLAAFFERGQHEEQAARESYEMDRDSATAAAQLLLERSASLARAY
jgi:hypothetical protein